MCGVISDLEKTKKKMLKATYVDPKFVIEFSEITGKYVSYSQFAEFSRCPLSWKLSYVDRLRKKDSSIHTIFGDAMHNVIQHWVRIMYTETIKAANALDFDSLLLTEMKAKYVAGVEQMGTHFSTKDELGEFYLDGLATLKWLRTKRTRFFDVKNETLVGTEVPLQMKLDGCTFVAYLDLVLRDEVSKRIKIVDFKTSNKGWNDYNKQDQTKVDQVLLYKSFYAKQYNIDPEMIDVEFIILKRKVNEQSEFPQYRVQVFRPTQGKIAFAKAVQRFDTFVKSCFLPDGTFNTAYAYIAKKGIDGKSCNFCQYKDNHTLCPPEQRTV